LKLNIAKADAEELDETYSNEDEVENYLPSTVVYTGIPNA